MTTAHESEKNLLRLAAGIWSETYKLHDDDENMLRYLEADAFRYLGIDDPDLHSKFFQVASAVKWVHCGAPRLITEARYASALMCSRITEAVVSDLIIPWKAFRISLPPGLLSYGEYEYNFLQVAVFEGRSILVLEGEVGASPEVETPQAWSVRLAPDPATLLLDTMEGKLESRVVDSEDKKERKHVLQLAARLVVGLLYEMQYGQHFKTCPMSLNDSRRSLREGPPGHRTIFVGRPIAFDARKEVRGFCREGRMSPSAVQTLVRGHYKRQVVGVSRSGRKVVWIEPYWRGPEDAPILARPYKIVGSTDKGDA